MPCSVTYVVDNFKAVAAKLSFRLDGSPIDRAALLKELVAARAAFVAQDTLYGYLQTRIGTRYPLMFDNSVFVESIDIAKFHVFAASMMTARMPGPEFPWSMLRVTSPTDRADGLGQAASSSRQYRSQSCNPSPQGADRTRDQEG